MKARIYKLLACLLALCVFSGCGGGENESAAPPSVARPSYPPPVEFPAYSGQWQDTGQPLSIYVDSPDFSAQDQRELEETLSSLLGVQPAIRWLILPRQQSEAEAFLSQLRIHLMAGAGPDLFLAFGADDTPGAAPVLFPQPESAMWSGAFLPLDGLLEDPQYMDESLFEPSVFSAGRTSLGQVVLPLSYDYGLVALSGEELPKEGPLPTGWEDLISARTPAAQRAVQCSYGDVLLSALGRLADYEEGKLLFTQEELFDLALAYTSALHQANEVLGPVDSRNTGTAYAGSAAAFSPLEKGWSGRGRETRYFPLWNRADSMTAEICTFAAVNRNTSQPGNAMLVLDALLSPQISGGRGFSAPSGSSLGVDLFSALFTAGAFSINTSAPRRNYPAADLTLLAALETEQHPAVRFCSALDSPLLSLALKCRLHYAQNPEESREALRSDVSDTWFTLEALLAE